LPPAYDIYLQGRTGNEAGQAIRIVGNNNLSQFKTCLMAAPNFLVSKSQAFEIFEHQVSMIGQNWQVVCDEAELSEIDCQLFWRRQFLNPFSVIE
jgi:serine/threonine-protein kinase HipA